MLRCEHCGAYIPEKGVFCPRCGEKVTPLEGKRKTAAGKWFRRMLGKFFALLLYLILSAVHDNLRKECHVKVGESCFICIPDKGGVSAEKQGSMLSCNKKAE